MFQKTKHMAKIELAVNSVNAEVVRTVPEIKKRWQDIKTSTKSKEGKRRKEMGKTGGEKAEFDLLNAVEEMAVGVIGKTAIKDIDEGLDSYDNDQIHNERKNDNGNSSKTNTHKTRKHITQVMKKTSTCT